MEIFTGECAGDSPAIRFRVGHSAPVMGGFSSISDAVGGAGASPQLALVFCRWVWMFTWMRWRQLNVSAKFICGDAEHLPWPSGKVDCIFSYSVLQHLDKKQVLRIFCEFSRVLKPQGKCLVQLPNAFGLLSILQQLKRGFRDAKSGTFEMRYWSHALIKRTLEDAGFSKIHIHADGFLSQNAQLGDLDLLSPTGKLIVLASTAARKAAEPLPFLARAADSLWIEAEKSAA